MSVAAVLLAAGASRRLGESKQLLRDEGGIPAVVRMCRVLRDGGCDRVVVVLGASAEAVRDTLDAHGELSCSTVVVNERWADGMGASIAAGVKAVATAPHHCDAVLIAACDMPSVGAAHVRALLDASGDGRRVASCYTGGDDRIIRGIPAVLPRGDFPTLSALDGDTGARALLGGADTITVMLAGGHFDLDTPADVERWREQSHLSPQPKA